MPGLEERMIRFAKDNVPWVIIGILCILNLLPFVQPRHYCGCDLKMQHECADKIQDIHDTLDALAIRVNGE